MKKRKIINNYDINKKVKELSELIKSKYEKEVVIVGVMNGSFYFMRDLMAEIECDFKYDFIFCSSYYGETKSSGKVKFLYPNKNSSAPSPESATLIFFLLTNSKSLNWDKVPNPPRGPSNL